jgi:cell division transport system ATP-binding protein
LLAKIKTMQAGYALPHLQYLVSQTNASPYIVFDNVEVRYTELVYGLRRASLEIAKGEFVFFCGKTGAGKSTVLKLLSCEVRHTAGRLLFHGRELGGLKNREIPKLRREMGIVPQDFALLPRKRVWENVGYAMRAIGATRREVRERVPDILERVNIGHRADAYPHELSGGEQQRVAIARALINNPSLLLADEPTGNLDPEHSLEIMDILQQLNIRGTTVLVASHDMLVVERMGKRVIRMQDGRIAEPDEVCEDDEFEPNGKPAEELEPVFAGLSAEPLAEAAPEAEAQTEPEPDAEEPPADVKKEEEEEAATDA